MWAYIYNIYICIYIYIYICILFTLPGFLTREDRHFCNRQFPSLERPNISLIASAFSKVCAIQSKQQCELRPGSLIDLGSHACLRFRTLHSHLLGNFGSDSFWRVDRFLVYLVLSNMSQQIAIAPANRSEPWQKNIVPPKIDRFQQILLIMTYKSYNL